MTFPVSAALFTAAWPNSIDSDHLQRLLDAAEQAINREVGPLGGVTSGDEQGTVREIITVHGDLLPLAVPAESIESVTEGRLIETVLAADDYELVAPGRIVRRLSTGTNSAYHWHERVDITYVPLSDVALREMAQIELVKLDIAFNPTLVTQTIGSWSESYQQGKSYPEQRADVLASLYPSVVGVW